MDREQTRQSGASTRDDRVRGRVLMVNGSQASVRLHDCQDGTREARLTVGKFLRLQSECSFLVGVITRIKEEGPGDRPSAVAEMDLLGEIRHGRDKAAFQRGVSVYPAIGDPVYAATSADLRLVYDLGGPDTIHVGSLQQDDTIAAYVNVDDMLRKHFALFGTTGVGKSSGVALLLNQVLEVRPHLRIFLIDPHNEYGRCFGDRAQVLNPANLRLPFWLFNFEEFVDVIFRGRPGLEEEVEILSEVIPIAKSLCASDRSGAERVTVRKMDLKASGFTVDTPVPYRLHDLVGLINERMGKLENRASWTKYNRLLTRIETVRNDPRYSFMFDNANVGGDTMVEVLSQLFRLPPQNRPMTVMQLAGFPAEVVDSVVSVLARMAFDFGLWSDGAAPLLFVCEEAHRYAPADRSIGFGPTRKAISRIAKEGRKYGVFLGLVTQRPAELDATIISQCSTLFAMRMANDRDQAIVRSAVSDAAASLLSFVPSLGTREVFAFGEGVVLPTRLHFKELAPHMIPKSEADGRTRMDASEAVDRGFITSVVERWRGAMLSGKAPEDDDTDDISALAFGEFSTVRTPTAPEPVRIASSAGHSASEYMSSRDVAPPRFGEVRQTAPARTGLAAEIQDLRQRLRDRSF